MRKNDEMFPLKVFSLDLKVLSLSILNSPSENVVVLCAFLVIKRANIEVFRFSSLKLWHLEMLLVTKKLKHSSQKNYVY